MQDHNKKSLDDVWTGLVLKIMEFHAPQAYFDTALEMSDPTNNLST